MAEDVRMNRVLDTIRYARKAGWPEPLLQLAVAVALAESKGDPNAIGDQHLINSTYGPSLGLMQVRSDWSQAETGGPRDMYRLRDPLENMRAALALYRGEDFKRKGNTWYEPEGFDAWSTYKDGSYKEYMPMVQRAIGLVDRAQ